MIKNGGGKITMDENIEYSFNRDVMVSFTGKLANETNELVGLHKEITSILGDIEWTGESYSNCVTMHNVIGLYQDEINGLLSHMVEILDGFCENIEDFQTNSDLVKNVKTIQ